MHVESSDPAPFHPRESSLQFPLPLSSDFVVIALARRVHHSSYRLLSSPCALRSVLCAFPFVLCSLRVPVCTRPFRSLRAFVFAFPAAPVMRFRFISIPFCPRPHCVPLRVPSHRAHAFR